MTGRYGPTRPHPAPAGFRHDRLARGDAAAPGSLCRAPRALDGMRICAASRPSHPLTPIPRAASAAASSTTRGNSGSISDRSSRPISVAGARRHDSVGSGAGRRTTHAVRRERFKARYSCDDRRPACLIRREWRALPRRRQAPCAALSPLVMQRLAA